MKRLAAVTLIAGATLLPTTAEAAHYTSPWYCRHSDYYTTTPVQAAMGIAEVWDLTRSRTTSTGSHFHRWSLYRRYPSNQTTTGYIWQGPYASSENYCGEIW